MKPPFDSVMYRIGSMVVAAYVLVFGPGSVRADDFEAEQKRFQRVRAAFSDHQAAWSTRFRDAGAAWPPRGLYLGAYKLEGEMELWAEAADKRHNGLVKVHRFPVCAASGTTGVKREEGDLQVPEGFYRIDRFNPRSSYHLSLGLDYPNAWDRERARVAGVKAGGHIFIHGGCVTIGCLPLGDEAIAGLYLVSVKARGRNRTSLPVHIHPCRFGTPRCETHLAGLPAAVGSDKANQHVWKTLREAARVFAETKRPATIEAGPGGYRVL